LLLVLLKTGKEYCTRKGGAMFKNKENEIRLVWRLLILVGLFLAFAYLLRYIPIRIKTASLMDKGFSSSAALSQAQSVFMEDEIWASVIGIIQGLGWYPLLYLMIKLVEKRKFSLKSIGFSNAPSSLILILLGIILGLVLYFGYFLFGSLVGQPSFNWAPEKMGWLALILLALNFITNGFGEESAFRAYFQDRLVDKHGMWLGVALASSAFVLLHLLIAPFSPLVLIASILLAAMYGILFLWTGSIYLVGTMHTIFNVMPRLLDQWPSDLGLLLGNGLGLIVILVLYFTRVEKKKEFD
jgi:membrane protease YdiL (CAAX protease family)